MKTGYKIGRRVAYGLLTVGLVLVVTGLMMGASWRDANVTLGNMTIFGRTNRSSLPAVPPIPDIPPIPDLPDVPDVPDVPPIPPVPDLPFAKPNYEYSHSEHSGSAVFLNDSYSGVSKLEYDIGEGVVTITTGSAFSIEASGEGAKFSSKVENGVWKIYARGYDGKKWRDHNEHYTVNITIPRDFVAEDINIDVGMGSVEADRLAAKKATINVGMGEVDIDDFTCVDTDIDCGMGAVELSGALTGKITANCSMGSVDIDINGKASDYGYTASVGMGEIVIGDNVRLAGMGGDSSNGRELPNQLILDCGMGSIEVDFE